jgi:hypothetical protein
MLRIAGLALVLSMLMPQARADATAELDRLHAAVSDAAARSDPAMGQRMMEYVFAAGPAVMACKSGAKALADFDRCEHILQDWKALAEANDQRLTANEHSLVFGRLADMSGRLSESHAQWAYYQDSDFITSRPLYEKAEGFLERALALFQPYSYAPKPVPDWWSQILTQEQAEIARVRGMKLLTQGEFELEAGALPRAEQLLTDAVASLREGESSTTDQSVPNFIDYAQAMLWRAKSDAALLAGDLAQAAAAQDERAKALERTAAQHARADTQVSDWFMRRLERDAFIAHQRHDRLAAAAAEQPRFAWLKPTLFFVMAMLPVGLFVRWNSRKQRMDDRIVLVAMLLYTFVVAGVGAQLVHWQEGAQWFSQALPNLKDLKPKGG